MFINIVCSVIKSRYRIESARRVFPSFGHPSQPSTPKVKYNFSSQTEYICFGRKLQKGCTRLAVASDTVYQLLAHGSLRVLQLLPPLKLVAMI